LAEGATAEVFAWGEDQILKLYRAGYPPDEAQREAQRARAAHAAGLPTPAVIDVVQVDGRQGVVYARVDGTPMMQVLLAAPDRAAALAAQLAELHAAMHQLRCETLPSQYDRLQNRIEMLTDLELALRQRALAILAGCPREHALCHGDFHPENVLLTAEGPMIIDWVDATQGAPAADVARTCLIMRYAGAPTHLDAETRQRLESLRRQFIDEYVRRYQQLHPVTDSELALWEIPLAVARLGERIDAAERQHLLQVLRAEILPGS
jgi:Ser/Thr protein kinase RdoA (MazF antagonist)